MSNWIFIEGPKKTWDVAAKDSGSILGEVKWLGRWRKYAFSPKPDTIYEAACLRDITAFIEVEMVGRGETTGATLSQTCESQTLKDLYVERDALRAELEILTGALADIGFSADMTLTVARKKAKRIYYAAVKARNKVSSA
jgi:hypothetical protein